VPTLDSENLFSYLYRSDGPWNATGYHSAEVDQLIDRIGREPDLKKRTQLMQECWRILGEAIVFVPLHYPKINWAMSTRLDLPVMPDNAPRLFWARFK
jgi:peptide/nickel transport system substrate-binding protein